MRMRRFLTVGAVATTLTAAGFAGVASSAAASTSPVTPVASVNLTDYLGAWYQIADIPLIFEDSCAKDAMANYTLAADGNVSVSNTCSTTTGGTYDVTGEAKIDNAPADSSLTVSFIDLFGDKFFNPRPNYDIIGLDPDYQWAVVVSPNRLSAFILSRTPALTSTQITDTEAALTSNGFNPCRLEVTPQDGGLTTAVKYCDAS
jgi:apolipoprotein D and lipocalin family protein